MPRQGSLECVVAVMALLLMVGQDGPATAQQIAELAQFDLVSRFARVCDERCLARLKQNKEKCISFCSFVPALVEEHLEDMQRLPLTAEEMVRLLAVLPALLPRLPAFFFLFSVLFLMLISSSFCSLAFRVCNFVPLRGRGRGSSFLPFFCLPCCCSGHPFPFVVLRR